MKPIVKRRLTAALLSSMFLACGAELNAWYYFTASNGMRCQWPLSRLPLKVMVDSDFSGTRPTTILVDGSNTGVLEQWNRPFGNTLSIFNTGVDYSLEMTLAKVTSYLRNPSADTVWIVHDTDGAILTYLGANTSSVLGLGIPICSAGSPNTIVSGIVIMNDDLIGDNTEYKKVLLHELGHVLGFAHSVSGGNKYVTVNKLRSSTNLPIMYPFIGSNSTLQRDDQAGIMAVYGQ